MRRRTSLLWFMVFALVALVLVLVLRQTAMFEEDKGPPHSSTQITLYVRYDTGHYATAHDTDLLWSVCASNVPHETITRTIKDGTLRATLTPALGEDVQRRFTGCLQDLTLPAMLGHVESVRVVPQVRNRTEAASARAQDTRSP